MAFVLMKFFEESPRRFDRMMHVITLGRLQKIRGRILDEMIEPGTRVLEVGCGTGALLMMMAERGARVTGIDAAPKMVETAREKIAIADLAGSDARRLHALQIEDFLEPASFDRVVSVLAFSEMTDAEVDALLPQCRQVLRTGGRLVLVDEVTPDTFFSRQLYRAYRWITRLFTFLGLQAVELQRANIFLKLLYFLIELPLMLLTFFVVPPLTSPLEQLDRRVERAGFRLLTSEAWLGGSLKMVYAEAVS